MYTLSSGGGEGICALHIQTWRRNFIEEKDCHLAFFRTGDLANKSSETVGPWAHFTTVLVQFSEMKKMTNWSKITAASPLILERTAFQVRMFRAH
jgi:hypothetical protein